MEVLAARRRPAALRAALLAARPAGATLRAVHAFIRQCDYVPSTGAELLAAVVLHRAHPERLATVGRLAATWADRAGYVFNVRDFHLLSRLAEDPLRKRLTRKELIVALSGSLGRRRHVRAAAVKRGGGLSDRFAEQVDRLSMADLWNLYLLDEMLRRPAVLLRLRVMSLRDRADTGGAWGGLISYRHGGAEARLYPAAADVPRSDLTYVPSRAALADSHDALCRFVGRFEKVDNAARAGPTAQELAEAAEDNFYALVLTSVAREQFVAHYYGPRGVVVSLGRFEFPQ
jgi:hypothetical protein